MRRYKNENINTTAGQGLFSVFFLHTHKAKQNPSLSSPIVLEAERSRSNGRYECFHGGNLIPSRSVPSASGTNSVTYMHKRRGPRKWWSMCSSSRSIESCFFHLQRREKAPESQEEGREGKANLNSFVKTKHHAPAAPSWWWWWLHNNSITVAFYVIRYRAYNKEGKKNSCICPFTQEVRGDGQGVPVMLLYVIMSLFPGGPRTNTHTHTNTQTHTSRKHKDVSKLIRFVSTLLGAVLLLTTTTTWGHSDNGGKIEIRTLREELVCITKRKAFTEETFNIAQA